MTVWTDEVNAWGLRPVSTTTLAGAATGARAAVTRRVEYDAVGRVRRTSDDAGHVEEWDRDAAGRLVRHYVAGEPAQEWRYAYQATGDRELTVTETLTSTGHARVKVYREGLLVSERWRYGAPVAGEPATAERTSSYVAGRLAETSTSAASSAGTPTTRRTAAATLEGKVHGAVSQRGGDAPEGDDGQGGTGKLE